MSETQSSIAHDKTIDVHTPTQRVPLTPGLLWDMRIPADPQLSRDGKRIAFTLREREGDKPRKQSHIWVVNVTEGEPEPFIKSRNAETCPRWSPDGKQLAFISKGEDEKDKTQLHIIPTDGGEAKQVCTMPNGVSDLTWSPDGSYIAFLSLEGEEPQTDPVVVSPGRHNRLWKGRPDYNMPEPITPHGVTVWEYTWSPNSKQLALYYSTGPDDTDWYQGQIGVVAASGGTVQQVTQLQSRQASALTWSPDGRRIASISGAWSDPGQGGGDIYVLSLEKGESQNITQNIESSHLISILAKSQIKKVSHGKG